MKDTPFATASTGERTIALSGDLDLAMRAQLSERFEDAAAQSNSVIVDLTQVTYMDSSAIGALIALYRVLHGRGGALRLRLRRNAAYRLLEIAGLTGAFPIDLVD